MLSQSQGKIYLSSERGHTETDTFRSYHTFNFGAYQRDHKGPFGALYALNDETLAGGKSVRLSVEEDTLILLLPLVGGIVTESNETESQFVYAGQLQSLFLKRGNAFAIKNPFNKELVNYLQIWIKYPFAEDHTSGVLSFDIDEKKNSLVPVFSAVQNDSFSLHATIGKFDGRKEITYSLTSAEDGVMVFIIQGAFELENRLLESRDGLALWNSQQVEMEALSNEAIILLLEIGQKREQS